MSSRPRSARDLERRGAELGREPLAPALRRDRPADLDLGAGRRTSCAAQPAARDRRAGRGVEEHPVAEAVALPPLRGERELLGDLLRRLTPPIVAPTRGSARIGASDGLVLAARGARPASAASSASRGSASRPMSLARGRGLSRQMAASAPLRPAFRGPLHLPGEAAYDAHRATWSGSIDPRPAVVAEALTPSDVRAAVLIARSTGCRSPSRRPGTARSCPPTAACCSRPPRWPRCSSTPTGGSPASGRARAGAT